MQNSGRSDRAFPATASIRSTALSTSLRHNISKPIHEKLSDAALPQKCRLHDLRAAAHQMKWATSIAAASGAAPELVHSERMLIALIPFHTENTPTGARGGRGTSIARHVQQVTADLRGPPTELEVAAPLAPRVMHVERGGATLQRNT
jgi:hypothetical protein